MEVNEFLRLEERKCRHIFLFFSSLFKIFIFYFVFLFFFYSPPFSSSYWILFSFSSSPIEKWCYCFVCLPVSRGVRCTCRPYNIDGILASIDIYLYRSLYIINTSKNRKTLNGLASSTHSTDMHPGRDIYRDNALRWGRWFL